MEGGFSGRWRSIVWALRGCYYSVGPTAKDDLSAYFNDYYPAVLPGPVEPLMGLVTTVTPDAIRATVRQFEDVDTPETYYKGEHQPRLLAGVPDRIPRRAGIPAVASVGSLNRSQRLRNHRY